MKRLVNIEQMDPSSLESAAAKGDVQVPEDLQERIESALAAAILADGSEGDKAEARPAGLDADAQAAVSARLADLKAEARPASLEAGGAAAPLAGYRGGRRLRWLPLAGIAAAAAIALLLMLPRASDAPLRDTYDDPELAYAQVEETFKMISSKMAGGVALAAESGKQAGKPAQIIDKINRK